MTWLERCRGKFPIRTLAVALGACCFAPPSSATRGGDEGGILGRLFRREANVTAPGAPAPARGFQGFGLAFHPGYGYGGDGLGVGPEGGYPFYGGPGYPRQPPPLIRLHRIVPFAYNGNPSNPCLSYAYQFANLGPLVDDPPVVFSGADHIPRDQATDFGPFTGGAPNAMAAFAPFESEWGVRGSSSGLNSSPTTAPTPPPPPPTGPGPDDSTPPIPPSAGRGVPYPAPVLHLGIDEEPVVQGDGSRGLRVAGVHPGSVAEKAGLRAGDVIRSINGQPTTELGNLAWIIAHAPPDKVLRVRVVAVADRKERTVTARLP